MQLILVIVAIAGLAWPIQMTPSEEFEKELTILKMDIENLKKSDMALKAWPIQMTPSEEFEKELTILKMEIENLKKSGMALNAWPIPIAPSEEFEMELTILKMEIENLKKGDMELKEKIEKMESNEGRMKEDIVKMRRKMSDMERIEMSKKMKFSSVETRKETLNNDKEMKKTKKAKAPVNNHENIENMEDQNDEMNKNIFRDHGMENALVGEISGRDNDCCANLTTEINDIKMNMEHFNERLNDNTRKIIENQLEMQNDKKQIETNANNIDTTANEVAINTNNVGDNKKQIETNENNIDTNANEVAINTNNVGDLMKRSDYCAYRGSWDHHTHQVILFDHLFLSNNFDIPGAQMDIEKGEFIAGVNGIYEIDVSLRMTSDHTSASYIYLRRNGKNVDESRVHTYGNDFAGKNILLRLDAGDIVTVFADQFDTSLLDITFCIHLLK